MILTPEKPEKRSEWMKTNITCSTSHRHHHQRWLIQHVDGFSLLSLSFLLFHILCAPLNAISFALFLFFPSHIIFSCMFFLFSVVITADRPGGKMVTPTQHFNYWYLIRYLIHQESENFARFIQHMMMIPCKKAAKRSARFGGPEWHTTKKKKKVFPMGKRNSLIVHAEQQKKSHNSQRKSSPSFRACYMKTNR